MISLTSLETKLAVLGYVFAAVLTVFLLQRLLSKSGIHRIAGPKPQSWLLGNQAQIERSPSAGCDFKWFRQFGHTWRIRGGFSEDILMTADPKALQFILQTSGYNFQKVPFLRERTRMLTGPGILWSEGEIHKRFRKVMLPSFALPEIKALAPIFHAKAKGLVNLLTGEISQRKEKKVPLNVHSLLDRATLDAIGEAAFDYKFGALEEEDNPLAKNFQGLALALGGFSSTMKIIITNALAFLPPTTILIGRVLPTNGNQHLRRSLSMITDVSRRLVKSKIAAMETQSERKDVMSLLVRSNISEHARAKLSEKEMISQMNTLMVAGHETTSNTLTWCLWELSKNPDVQDKLRKEVREWYQMALDRGDDQIPASDYEKMDYTMSFVKEVLRFHPILPNMPRIADRDIVVPLSNPIETLDGEIITEIPLKKGTRVLISVAQYNRLPELWGPDFDVFRPERWSEGLNSKVKFGVIGNLATFGAGIRACLGWRFAVYEIQAFLIELVKSLKFEMAEETGNICRVFSGVIMQPVVEGQRETSMPMLVSAAA